MNTHDEYHAAPGVSSHRLADFRTGGPTYFYRKHVQGAIPDRDSAAYAFGRAFHSMTLEGVAAFQRDYVIAPPEHLAPSGGMSTKAATREWKAEQTQGILTPNEAELCAWMSAAVRANTFAAGLLARGKPEVAKFATHATGLTIKGRADWDAEDYGVDLKSCRNLDEFEGDARRYGYIEQGAFYRRLFQWRKFYLVACEKEGANRVRVYRISDDALDAAQEGNERALADLANRYAADDWADHALLLTA